MNHTATARFTNESHSQEPYGPAEARLSRISIERAFSGDLVGTSSAELLACMPDDGRFSYVGMDRFAGRLGDRSGTFSFQHGGRHEKGALAPFGYIVPGSGTDDFEGIVGEAVISVSDAGQHTVVFHFDFE